MKGQRLEYNVIESIRYDSSVCSDFEALVAAASITQAKGISDLEEDVDAVVYKTKIISNISPKKPKSILTDSTECF